MKARVKICGVTRVEDALCAAEHGAWAVGLIFDPESPRCVSLERAQAIDAALPKKVLRVGVFRDQPLRTVRAALKALRLDLIQAHGDEKPAYLSALGLKNCVKAVVLKDEDSVAEALACKAAYLLVDRPRIVTEGRGRVNWSLVGLLAKRRKRTILAGGLTPENVALGIERAAPWGVDVSSGVESAPGIKDPAAIRAFLKEAGA